MQRNQGGLLERDEWSDLHSYLSTHAPMHRVGGVGARRGHSNDAGDGGANVCNGGGEDSSTGHTAKSMGTAAAAAAAAAVSSRGGSSRSSMEDVKALDRNKPCLLWSLSGQGMSTAYSEEMTAFASASTVTYGAHAVVRGYHGGETVQVGRHELSHNVLLDMYLRRTFFFFFFFLFFFLFVYLHNV